MNHIKLPPRSAKEMRQQLNYSFSIVRFQKLANHNDDLLHDFLANSTQALKSYKKAIDVSLNENHVRDLIHQNTTIIHYLEANGLAKKIGEYQQWLTEYGYESQNHHHAKVPVLAEFDRVINGPQKILNIL